MNMRQRFALVALSISLVGAVSSNAIGQEVVIDAQVRYQTFEGWGTSLAWWAHVVGDFPEPVKSEYMSRIFGQDGLALNIVRYNIGGGENPELLPPNRTYLPFHTRIPGYSPRKGVYDWTQDAAQRTILRQSIASGVNIVEGFSNSPPYWMTVSGSVTGNKDARDNLRDDAVDEFADYLVEVSKHFKEDWGVTFRTLEPFNEPNSGYWHLGNNQEGCGFSTAQQSRVIDTLARKLATSGLKDVGLSASDETSIDTADLTLREMDEKSVAHLRQVNTHSYKGSQRRELHDLSVLKGKRIWASEYGDADQSGLTMAQTIVKDLRELQPSAWIYWQAVDRSPGWGFMRNALDGTDPTMHLNPKYYVMQNFSRYIRPGYRFVSIADPAAVAAIGPNGSLTVVAVNAGDTALDKQFHLSGFTATYRKVTIHRTAEVKLTSEPESQKLAGPRFDDVLQPHSVTTYVFDRRN
jgi:O-glycosyl hydrolase